MRTVLMADFDELKTVSVDIRPLAQLRVHTKNSNSE
jgi:hypothetical protein